MTSLAQADSDQRLRRISSLWHDLLQSKPSEDLSCYLHGPEFALRFLTDDLALGRLTNSELRAYLARELMNAPSFKGRRRTELGAVLNQIAKHVEQGRSEYLAALVRHATVLCERGEYVRTLTEHLQEYVKGSRDQAHLDSILQQLLTAIEIRGSRRRSSSSNLFNEIFYNKAVVVDGHYHNQYPLEAFDQQEVSELRGLEDDTSTYEALLRKKCDALSIEDRFHGLARAVLNIDRTSRTYIFPIIGIKGLKSFTIGNVEFYAPAVSPKLLDDNAPDRELFERDEQDALNVAVTVPGTFVEASQKALRSAETALDLLAYYASGYEYIELGSNRMLVVDHVGNWRGSSSSIMKLHEKLVHNYRSLESDRLLDATIFPHIQGAANAIALLDEKPRPSQRLAIALRAFKKAEDSSIAEDRLVNYWIAIESLLTSDRRTGYFKQESASESAEQLALRVLPALSVMSMISSVATDLMGYLRNAVSNERNVQEYGEALAGVSEKLRSDSHVVTGPWMSYPLNAFIERLDGWRKAVLVGSVVFERVDFAFKFYTENSVAKRVLETHKARVLDQVIVIYQLRNRIVHNAYFDPLGLDYFIASAQGHAKRLIGCVLAHPHLKAFEALTEQCALADRLLLMLNDAEHVDLSLYGTTL